MYRIQLSKVILDFHGGRRRRTVETAEGPHTLVFGGASVYLDWLPPEIASDEHLVVTEVSSEAMKLMGGTLYSLAPPPGGLQQEGSKLNSELAELAELQQVELSKLASPAQNPSGLPVGESRHRRASATRGSRR